jgi:hypothetical protein
MLLLLLACRTTDKVDDSDVFVDTQIEDTQPDIDTGPYDADGDGVVAAEDCDDNDPALGAALDWYRDADGDGWGDEASLHYSCEQPSGSIGQAGDCDDTNGAIHPDATEVCDGLDNDCDGLVDGDDDSLDVSTGALWYADEDQDGWGDDDATEEACEQPEGAVDVGGDCDDEDAAVNPDAVELIDGDDEDCDGTVDEAAVLAVYGLNCLAYSGSATSNVVLTDDEHAGLSSWLAGMSLGVDRSDEPPAGWDGNATLEDYDLVLYTKCGWAWDAENQLMVDALVDARDAGVGTFVFDDDITFRDSYVTGEEPLILMPNGGGNGSSGVVTMTGVSHDAYAGPYGTPVDFTYTRDMDDNAVWGQGETVLATHGITGGPVWAVFEDTGKSAGRGACYVGNFVANNHGYATADELVQHELIFKNTVAWLLEL